MDRILPEEPGADWIEDLTDDQCLEVFWLYVESPERLFARFPKRLLGEAMRYALRAVMAETGADEARSGAPRT